MSGLDCLAMERLCCEPSGATRCRRERLPSTRTLKRSQMATSGPLTEECSAGFDSIRIACAQAGRANPANRIRVNAIEMDSSCSAQRRFPPLAIERSDISEFKRGKLKNTMSLKRAQEAVLARQSQ